MGGKRLYAVFVCFILLTVSVAPLQVGARSVTDTISIYIGYFGWTEDQFVYKATFHWRELDDMFGGDLTTHTRIYSYSSGRRMFHGAARGFYIRDLLRHAGVDFGSVARIDFFTRDHAVGPYRSFTRASLFDMPRYYFPNLAACELTGEKIPYYGDDIRQDAIRVAPMLALESFTQWDNVGYHFEAQFDPTLFSATTRFRLFFGQLSPTEANTSSSAKYVYKLLITFNGTPRLSTEYTNIEMLVGSATQIAVNVASEDRLLDEYVSQNLVWHSDNEDAVTVDQYGNITVVGFGEAVITASFHETYVAVTVRVGEDEMLVALPGTGEGDYRGVGVGAIAGDGVGDIVQGDGEGDIDLGDGLVTGGSSEEVPDDEPVYAYMVEPAFAESIPNIFAISEFHAADSEFMELVNSILNHRHPGDVVIGAQGVAHGGGMSADAVQLVLLAETLDMRFVFITAGIVALFFISGFGYGILSFRKKRQGAYS